MASSLAGLRRAKPYPSDVTDDQWAIIAPFVATTAQVGPGSKGGRPLDYDRREIIDAIFYENRTGCQWRYLPHDFPPHETVYRYFRTWSANGTLEAIHDALHEAVRSGTAAPDEHGDGGGQATSVRLSVAHRGGDRLPVRGGRTHRRAGPATRPRPAATGPRGPRTRAGMTPASTSTAASRHVLVDTLGLVIDVVVTAASVSDNAGGLAVLAKAVGKEAGAHLQKVWVDAGYKNAFAAGAERPGRRCRGRGQTTGAKRLPRPGPTLGRRAHPCLDHRVPTPGQRVRTPPPPCRGQREDRLHRRHAALPGPTTTTPTLVTTGNRLTAQTHLPPHALRGSHLYQFPQDRYDAACDVLDVTRGHPLRDPTAARKIVQSGQARSCPPRAR